MKLQWNIHDLLNVQIDIADENIPIARKASQPGFLKHATRKDLMSCMYLAFPASKLKYVHSFIHSTHNSPRFE